MCAAAFVRPGEVARCWGATLPNRLLTAAAQTLDTCLADAGVCA